MDTVEYVLTVDTFAPVLRSLSALLDKGAEHARERSLDLAALLDARLAPDMFPLSLQVQLSCHHAKDALARITGQEPPKLEMQDLTFADLKALIDETVGGLTATDAATLEGALDRRIEMPLQDGALVFEADALHFLCRWSLPHFFFHVVTAYDILRHNGVSIGKIEYVSHVGVYIRQREQA